MQRLLIVGSGDIARRALPFLAGRYRLFALVRSPEKAARWRSLGVIPVPGDLDDRRSLTRLAGLADLVLHLAPPPPDGTNDWRTRNLLSSLSAGASLPRRIVYISTTGVYGDCGGEWLDETHPARPGSARAGRRVDAERQLRRFGSTHRVAVSILRAPGIYGPGRLPRERLLARTPVPLAGEDGWTNHIHADDLAAACAAALRRGLPNRVVNAVDRSELRLGDYLDRVAACLGLRAPPRLPLAEVRAAVSPLQWSFLRESRRIRNFRLERELKLRLRHPTVEDGLAALPRQDTPRP